VSTEATLSTFLCLVFLVAMASAQGLQIDTGRWTVDEINNLLSRASKLPTQQRIAHLSREMLGLPYNDKTLIGDIKNPEVFVINLAEMDCLTFLDYIEAMRLSKDFAEFKEHLKGVRYKSARVDFRHRRHFFTDWANSEPSTVADVTRALGGNDAKAVNKTLNIKRDGSRYLNGLPPVKRQIWYIPASKISEETLNKLQTGDYIGIYTTKMGLDVSHVGIFIREGDNRPIFRHASSLKGKVVDEDFSKYVSRAAGIVVLRPMR